MPPTKTPGAKSLDRRPRKGQAEAATQRAVRHKFANSRTALQRSGDLAFLTKWRLLGLTLPALVEKLNGELPTAGRPKLSRAQIAADLKAVDNAWRAERQANIEALRDRELAKMDVQERELWNEWEKSKKATGKRYTQVIEDGTVDKKGKFTGDRKTVKSLTDSDSYGDPAIMAQIGAIQDRRGKICGWIAPQKIQAVGPDGGPLPVGAGAVPIINLTINAPRPGEA